MSATQLALREVTHAYRHRVVLDRVTCAFTPGTVTGVIGENGSGKSTLLRLLAGVETPGDGSVAVQADGVGHLAQDSPLPQHLTVDEVIDVALADLRAIERRLRVIEADLEAGHGDIAEYGTLLTRFELRDGYEADARVRQALAGLGLADLPGTRRLRELSGGEQVRLHLAAVLAAAPEVLLLDEPTNHLDSDATRWLEARLRARRGTTVVVSHDRVLLDGIAATLLEVDGDSHRVARFTGGYDGFLAARAAERERRIRAREDWEAGVAELHRTIRIAPTAVAPGRAITDNNKMAYGRAGDRVQGSIAARVRNARERLRRLEEDPVPVPPAPLRFAATFTGGGDGSALEAAGVTVTGRLAPTCLSVRAGAGLLVTGPNGAGKTTLLRVLAGERTPDGGRVRRRGRVGHLPQETSFDDLGASVLRTFARGRTGTADEHATALAALGLLPPERFGTPVGELSTGQRRRLALARLVTAPVDVLLLDEPTNHLSLGLVEDLEAALDGFAGALVVVSHDRRFRDRWTGGVLDLGERSVAERACRPRSPEADRLVHDGDGGHTTWRQDESVVRERHR